MPHDVIMPALGMAQDTGLIVAWHKKPGDRIAADDVLMEVETDKATMEVPAGVEGTLLNILFEAGTAVPVGDVIAHIGDEGDADLVVEAPAAPEPARTATPPEPVADEAPPPTTTIESPKPVKPFKPAPVEDVAGKVLASPKSRRLALQEGLDLGMLARAGIPQPYHVSDLQTLREIAAKQTNFGAAPVTSLEAEVEGAALKDLRGMSIGKDEAVLADEAIWAAFAASSYATTLGISDIVRVKIVTPATGREAHYLNPHVGGISRLNGGEIEGLPDIGVVDLTGGHVTGLRPGTAETPILSVAGKPGAYRLVLSFREDLMDLDTAYALLEAFAARMDQPLLHIF